MSQDTKAIGFLDYVNDKSNPDSAPLAITRIKRDETQQSNKIFKEGIIAEKNEDGTIVIKSGLPHSLINALTWHKNIG